MRISKYICSKHLTKYTFKTICGYEIPECVDCKNELIPNVNFSEEEKSMWCEIRHYCDKEVFTKFELHADGVKEVKCQFCESFCGNEHCPYNEENKEQ